MRYINTKTGAVIDSPFNISGGDWKLSEDIDNKIDETKVKETPKIEVEKEVHTDDPLENDAQFKNINIEQIKQELDAFGVKYDPKAKKKELYDLMLAQGK